MEIKFYAIRHKETGRFYQFHELCEDGWGYYSPSCSEPSIDDLPYFTTTKTIPTYGIRKPEALGRRNEMVTPDEVEFVEFNLNW